MPADNDIFVFADIETSGLDPRKDAILEVGIKVVDLDFEPLAEIKRTIYYDTLDLDLIKRNSVEFVRDMHAANGLWKDCASDNAVSLWAAEEELAEWMVGRGFDGNPMCGSSLRLDRNFFDVQMPELHKTFHYRSIDNSTIKELCKRLNPSLYDQMVESETDHRVFTCLDGTIAEAKFYADNFFFVEEA